MREHEGRRLVLIQIPSSLQPTDREVVHILEIPDFANEGVDSPGHLIGVMIEGREELDGLSTPTLGRLTDSLRPRHLLPFYKDQAKGLIAGRAVIAVGQPVLVGGGLLATHSRARVGELSTE